MLPKLILNIERWKYNKTFELYVSNMGHIRNKSKADIAPKVMENGYMVVYVNGSINGYMLLHRVVMLTWKPTPEAEQLTVDHLDHNKRNNALYNLEWVSRGENLKRARRDFCSTRPVDYEYITNVTIVSGDPNTKRAKKATAKAERERAAQEYIEKISKVTHFLIEPDRSNGANNNRPTLKFTPNAEGYAEVKKAIEATKGMGAVSLSKIIDKVTSMQLGNNRLGHSTYGGMIIRPLWEEN